MSESENSAISEFCKVTGSDETNARAFLEASNWDCSLAVSHFFEDDTGMQDEAPPAYVRPGSPKPPPATRSSANRVTTFSNLADDSDNDDDEEEGQAFYAGGSERSGQQVIGPGKQKGGHEIVEDLFNSVRKYGGQAVDQSPQQSSKGGKSKTMAFRGAGHVLGYSAEGASSSAAAVPGEPPSAGDRPVMEVRLQMWPGGFTVDDGPLREYQDPQNKSFLDSIRKGEIPSELLQRAGRAEVHLNMEDRSTDQYIPKKPVVKAFTGAGHRLGNITPVVTSNTPGSSQASAASAQDSLQVDESQPVTNIQIRLADGARLQMRANHTHTVGDVRRFIIAAHPQFSAHEFSLMTSYPTAELTNEEATLAEANVLNAVIVQKLK